MKKGHAPNENFNLPLQSIGLLLIHAISDIDGRGGGGGEGREESDLFEVDVCVLLL